MEDVNIKCGCGEVLERWQIRTHICKGAKWYLIGVMPLDTPDKNYWFDRFEYVAGHNEKDAIAKWEVLREGWLCSDERRHIKVYDVKPYQKHQPSKYPWLEEQKKGGK